MKIYNRKKRSQPGSRFCTALIPTIPALAILCTVLSVGCHHSGTDGGAKPESSGLLVAGQALDLTLPFQYRAGVGISGLAPLSFSQQLAKSGGGTWIVLASKPLEDVKLPVAKAGSLYRGNPLANLTVQKALEVLSKAGTPMSWDATRGYVLLDFAPNRDIDRVRTAPPTETVGVMFSSNSLPELAHAIGDVWKIKLEVDATLMSRWIALRTERKKLHRDLSRANPQSSDQDILAAQRYGTALVSIDDEDSKLDPFQVKALDRLDLGGMLQVVARSLGGESKETTSGQWKIGSISDPQKQQAEVIRLKASIDQLTGSSAAGFTSFSDRSGSGSGSLDDVADQPVPITPVSDEAYEAFTSLAMQGVPAIPTLTAYLDPEKPTLARTSAEILAIMGIPEAKKALADYLIRLRTPSKTKLTESARSQLLSEAISITARDGGDLHTIAEIALDESVNKTARQTARMALVYHGNVSEFAEDSSKAKSLNGEMEFLVKYPAEPGRPQEMKSVDDPKIITPIATTRTQAGDVWAVFLSGRLGNPMDMWLAHGRDQKWIEFLFTGIQFSRQSLYGNSQDEAPTKGACLIEATATSVTIKPPNSSVAAQIASLQKQTEDTKLSMDQRQKVYVALSQLQSKLSNVLAKAVTFNLDDLKRDSDKDGVPDLVELRLGTDPHKADTDADGVPDGKDDNPVAGVVKTPTTRNILLQQVFQAMYGKDQSPDPILVVLNKKYWQKFHGARARVRCITHSDLLKSARNFSGLRTLQFGGPQDADSTILNKDGPCFTNGGETLAEVHFWQNTVVETQTVAMARRGRYYGNSNATAVEYVARFEHKSEWKLVSIFPERNFTAERSATELMSAQQSQVNSDINE